MVPQLAQGFLQPRTRGRTGNPQRLQVGASGERRGSGGAGGQAESSLSLPPTREVGCPAAPLPPCPADSANPICPGKEWIGEPFDSDSGIKPVPTMYHGRVG